MNCHNLTLDVGKTLAMIIGTQKQGSEFLNVLHANNVPPLIVNGDTMPYVNSARNLGLIVDSALSWSGHCTVSLRMFFALWLT